MMGMCRYTVLWSLAFCLVTVLARNPGFKARISTRGFKYANSVAIGALKRQVEQLHIPGLSGKALGARYWIDNIRVTYFNPRGSTIDINPGHGLVWKASNTDLHLHGHWRYKWLFISDHGHFDARVAGISFSLGIDSDKDANGRPRIAAKDCSISIHHVDFKFHGRLARLYNLFRKHVGHYVKDTLQKQICKLIKKEVDKSGNEKLAKLHVTMPLVNKFLLDYRLIQNPSFQSQYMETYHKGEVYWLANPTSESPLVPPPIQGNADTDSMLYLWLSDYIFNTIGYQAQKHEFLVRNVTPNDLPQNTRAFLNTTCEGKTTICIGKLIPPIGEKYPNSVVELQMTSNRAPSMKTTDAGVDINLAGEINLHARKHGHQATSLLVSLNVAMNTTVNVSLHSQLLFAEIKAIQLNVKIGKSAIGSISSDILQYLVNQILKLYLIPHLNEIGAKGFPLPVTGDVQFQDAKISFAQDTVLISTDLKHAPLADDNLEDLPQLLKFKLIVPSYIFN